MPGSFDGNCQQSLMPGAVTGNPPGYNFTPFIDESSQQPVIMIADDVYLIFAEAAYAPSSSVKLPVEL